MLSQLKLTVVDIYLKMNMKNNLGAGVDAHTFKPSTLEPEVGDFCVFMTSHIYIVQNIQG